MKKTRNLLCVLLSLLLIAGAAVPAAATDVPAGAAVSIIDAFGYGLFSDDTLNDLLQVFPQMCEAWEGYAENAPGEIASEIEETFSEEPILCANAEVYMDGADGTSELSAFLASVGLSVYPHTLGAYLCDHGFADVGSALLAGGESWSEYAEDGTYRFSFDWGVDASPSPAARYSAFTDAVGTLLDAAPLLRAVLGDSEWSAPISGEEDFCHAILNDFRIKVLFTVSQTQLIAFDMEGDLSVSAGHYYSRYIVPVYRSLGLGSVISCPFPSLTEEMTGAQMAKTVFDPLYTLVGYVQNDPFTSLDLIAFYRGGGAAMLLSIPASDEVTVTARTDVDECAFRENPIPSPDLFTQVLFSIGNMVCGSMGYAFDITLTPFSPAGGTAAYLAGLLNSLVMDCGEGRHNDVVEFFDSDCHAVLCTVCGRRYTEPHLVVAEDVIVPTCAHDGTRQYRCVICGYERLEIIPTYSEHTWDGGIVTRQPTCTEDGVKTYTCAVCGETRTEAVEMLGHTAANDQGKCDRCGATLAEVCRYCGKIHTGLWGRIVAFLHGLLYSMGFVAG